MPVKQAGVVFVLHFIALHEWVTPIKLVVVRGHGDALNLILKRKDINESD